MALKELGTGLHSLQDIYAHADEYVSNVAGIYSHAHPRNLINRGPNLADDREIDETRIVKTEKKTREYLDKFNKETRKCDQF